MRSTRRSGHSFSPPRRSAGGAGFPSYCYRVYHWNLPGNPVDLEQREGRVHRFKGHAVRLNLASAGPRRRGPWAGAGRSVEADVRARAIRAAVDTDLILTGSTKVPVRVERRVPMLPFSREVTRLALAQNAASRSIALAFGQTAARTICSTTCKLWPATAWLSLLGDLQIRLRTRVSDRPA